jgi:hypothetical protein
MRLAQLVSAAALVVGVGGVMGAMACRSGNGSGSGGDDSLTVGGCDPNNDPLIDSCALPCQVDVEEYCDNGEWVCPAQPTEPVSQSPELCLHGADAAIPECSSGPARCGACGPSSFPASGATWYCPDDGGFVDAQLPDGGVDAADAADAPADVIPDAAAPVDAPTD